MQGVWVWSLPRKLWSKCVLWAQSLQSYLTLWDPMDCSPPGSSVHGILQARALEWVAMPSSRGSSQLRDWTHVSCIGRQALYHWEAKIPQPVQQISSQALESTRHNWKEALGPQRKKDSTCHSENWCSQIYKQTVVGAKWHDVKKNNE